MYFDIETRTIYREFSDIPSEKRRDILYPSAYDAEEAEIIIKTFPDYMMTDQGESVTPRYSIIRKPVIGDCVASFVGTGDDRPEGKITSISESLKVITLSSGEKYYRQGKTKYWKSKDRTLHLKMYND